MKTTFDPNKATMVCMPVSIKDATIVAGSIKEECCKCETKVWLTPESNKMREEKDLQIVCWDCVAKQEMEDPRLNPPSEGQLREILRTLADQN